MASKTQKKSTSSSANNLPQKEKLPLFLNIIFHIYFAATIIWLAFSILSFAGFMPIRDIFFSSIGLSFFIGNGIALMIICAVYLIIAIGLLQLRKWARTLTITFAIIETLISALILTRSVTQTTTLFAVFSLIIHGFVAIYFLFSKSVLRLFGIT